MCVCVCVCVPGTVCASMKCGMIMRVHDHEFNLTPDEPLRPTRKAMREDREAADGRYKCDTRQSGVMRSLIEGSTKDGRALALKNYRLRFHWHACVWCGRAD